jgi:hypothetical protein
MDFNIHCTAIIVYFRTPAMRASRRLKETRKVKFRRVARSCDSTDQIWDASLNNLLYRLLSENKEIALYIYIVLTYVYNTSIYYRKIFD